MQNCSKLFVLKSSKPNISSTPMDKHCAREEMGAESADWHDYIHVLIFEYTVSGTFSKSDPPYPFKKLARWKGNSTIQKQESSVSWEHTVTDSSMSFLLRSAWLIRRTIQSKRALYKDLAIESRAVMACKLKAQRKLHITLLFSSVCLLVCSMYYGCPSQSMTLGGLQFKTIRYS